jgi:hypothetical protein
MTVQRGRRDHHTIHMRSGPRLHGTSSTTRVKKAETLRRIPRPGWCEEPGRDGGGMPRPDYGPPNLTFWPLNVVNDR